MDSHDDRHGEGTPLIPETGQGGNRVFWARFAPGCGSNTTVRSPKGPRLLESALYPRRRHASSARAGRGNGEQFYAGPKNLNIT
jgi:hypothetical protein